jgi:hypothetical protein
MLIPKVPRRLLVGVAVCVAVLTSVVAFAAPASAASAAGCAAAPSNNNCNNVRISPGDACWNSSYTVESRLYWDPIDIGWGFTTELMYSIDCQVNWARTTVTTTGVGVYSVSNKIRRGATPYWPYLMFHGPWITMYEWSVGAQVISPMVWSPFNPAQACLSNGISDQVDCTDYV